MKDSNGFKQNGIGLIEVLVALLVVSLGLLALAGFQGNLLNVSGNNKAKAEAIGLAQQELELIRYAASSIDDFEVLTTPQISTRTLNGTNAQFLIEATTDDDPSADTIISVAVDVSWTDARGEQDSVTLMSEVSLQDVQKSAFATNDSAGAVAVPSPRQSASEDVRPASENVDDPTVISPTNTPLPARGTVRSDESRKSKLAETFSVNSTIDGTPVTLTAIAEDSRYYNTKFDEGVLGVYVCESTASNGCRYIQNHFGGVSLSTSGVIYSDSSNDNDLSDVRPVWSSSEVTACYEGPASSDAVGGDMKPYECVYAGNCSDNPESCQQDVTAEEIEKNGVGPGGEFGNLGLIGLSGSNDGDQVCFLEDTPEIPSENKLSGRFVQATGNAPQYNENLLFPVTTRTYVTRRLDENGLERSEGINKSYRNHNFLLVNRAKRGASENCPDAVNANTAIYTLAPREIIRINSTESNFVETEPDEFLGQMPGTTIPIMASAGSVIYYPEVGACYGDGSEYACAVPGEFNGGSIELKLATPTFGGTSTYQTCVVNVTSSEISECP